MNVRVFMDYYSVIDVSDLIIKATSIDDDVGTTLRIHLLCERLAEAWICAHCSCPDLFGNEKERVRMECDAKIAMAGNLGLPQQIIKTLKTINSLRNDIAHNTAKQEIPDSRIQSMAASLGDYLRSVGGDINKLHVAITSPEGNEKVITLSSDSSQNRLKLCAIFAGLLREVAKIAASKHTGRWDNDFTQRQ